MKKIKSYVYFLTVCVFLLPVMGHSFDREQMRQAMQEYRSCLEGKGVSLPERPSREEMKAAHERGERPQGPQLSQEQINAMKECRELAGLPDQPRRQGPPRGAFQTEDAR